MRRSLGREGTPVEGKIYNRSARGPRRRCTQAQPKEPPGRWGAHPGGGGVRGSHHGFILAVARGKWNNYRTRIIVLDH